jgi:hypothetical protein
MEAPSRLARFRRFADQALGRGRPFPRRRRHALASAVFLVSFAVRSLYAVDLSGVMYSHRMPGTRMAARYDAGAMAILRGEGILFPRQRPAPEDTSILARPPGYALFTAGVYATLGRSAFAVQLVQNLLNSVSPVLLFLIVGRVLSWRVGAVGALIAAVSPHLAYASNLVLPDALCALPLLGAVYLLTRGDPDRRSGLATAAAAGALVGAAIWLRPNVLLLGPFLAFFLWLIAYRRRRALLRGLILAGASLLVVSPITMRNYLLFGELVPVSINGGITLWQGVADAGGRQFGAAARDKMVIAEETTRSGDPRYEEWWAAPDGIQRDRDRYRRAWSVILAHPLWYARAMLGRMADMIDYDAGVAPLVVEAGTRPEQVERPDTSAFHSDRPPELPLLPPRFSDQAAIAPGRWLSWARTPVRAVQAAVNATLLPLLLAGAAAVFAFSWRGAVFLLMVPLYYFVFESMFLFEWRVAVPMHYFLFAFAATSWVLAWEAARRLRTRPGSRSSGTNPGHGG